MDVKLQNAYVNVLLDNFVSVIKQNVMFQAQLEVNKNEFEVLEDFRRQVNDLSRRNEELQHGLQQRDFNLSEKDKQINSLISEKDNLKSSLNTKDTQANVMNSIVAEKNRLQNAVNDYMRQLEETRKEILKVKIESQEILIQNVNKIEELNRYILKLENVVPAAKLKKVRLGENVQPEPIDNAQEENDLVKSGGTF
jgi:SMC interacting uncharacterized protein involved in chromosome segregation